MRQLPRPLLPFCAAALFAFGACSSSPSPDEECDGDDCADVVADGSASDAADDGSAGDGGDEDAESDVPIGRDLGPAPDSDGSGDVGDDVGPDGGDDVDPEDVTYPPLAFTVTPADGDTFVPLDGTITVQFNQPMNSLRFIPSNLLVSPFHGAPIERLIAYNPDTFTLTLSQPSSEALFRAVTPYTFRMGEFISSVTGEEIGAPVTTSFSTTGFPGRGFLRQLAYAYAPTVYQEVESYDIDTFTRIDFDGDLLPANNFDNRVGANYAFAYYDVIETPTHYYIAYLYYFLGAEPRTAVFFDHDIVVVQVVVQKMAGDPLGRLRAFSTRNKESFNQWLLPASAYDGVGEPTAVRGGIDGRLDARYLEGGRHISLFIESLRHGVCLPNASTPKGPCAPDDGASAPFDRGATGLIVRPAEAALRPGDVADDAVTYSLRSFAEEFWALRNRFVGVDAFYGGEAAYNPAETDGGLRPGAGEFFPTSLNADEATRAFGELPFTFSSTNERGFRGAWYADPAFGLGKTLALPETVSLEYCFNPYLGIDQRDSREGCTPTSFLLPE